VKQRPGFALMAALWLIVALGAVSLDASLRSQTRRLATANIVDETRARQAAVAGAEYARARLSAALLDRADELRAGTLERQRVAGPQGAGQGGRQRTAANLRTLLQGANPLDDPWREPQQLVEPELAVGAASAILTLRDASAAVNLNAADERMIRDFLTDGLELDYAAADRLTQAILDWRDEDDLPRVNGAERDEYLRRRRAVLPPNRDFGDVDELRHVLGMTPELFDRAAPHLSVVGSGRINVNTAPLPVLAAVPGLTRSAAAELIRLREAGQTARNSNELAGLLGGAAAAALHAEAERLARYAAYSTAEVEIISEGGVSGSPISVRVTTLAARTNTGAVSIWRRIQQ